jgi:Skp family chaperone for outer membrane proteins
MLVMINYVHESFSESLSTLCFAERDKKIINRFVIIEDLNNRALFKQYELELRNLRNELEKKNKKLQSNELVMQFKEEKEQGLKD